MNLAGEEHSPRYVLYSVTLTHPISVPLPDAEVNRYSQSFKYTDGQLWDTLPSSIYPFYCKTCVALNRVCV